MYLSTIMGIFWWNFKTILLRAAYEARREDMFFTGVRLLIGWEGGVYPMVTGLWSLVLSGEGQCRGGRIPPLPSGPRSFPQGGTPSPVPRSCLGEEEGDPQARTGQQIQGANHGNQIQHSISNWVNLHLLDYPKPTCVHYHHFFAHRCRCIPGSIYLYLTYSIPISSI